MTVATQNPDEITPQGSELAARYAELQALNLNLDLTRGKPSVDQLGLSEAMDGILAGVFVLEDGTDLRNYGGLDGIPAAKRLGAEILEVPVEQILVGGNASLTLMYHYLLHAHLFGLRGEQSAWVRSGTTKFLCPVPGYDRHFAICQALGIEMLPVAMDDDGPDMAAVERAVGDDPAIRGIWCVPKYSNPTGCIYSDETVDRLAALGRLGGAQFRVMYDNAYAVHDFSDQPRRLANVWEASHRHGSEDNVVLFGSTSKITFAGAGLAFCGASSANLAAFKQHLETVTIGPDKINQQRHALLLPDRAALQALMRRHASVVRPKFECVAEKLRDGLGNRGIGHWSEPQGGYFVSFYAPPGLASEIVRLAAAAGVKLTPAGAAFPYGNDPQDSHIRLAPTFPTLDELAQAMDVFVLCVQLASERQQLAG